MWRPYWNLHIFDQCEMVIQVPLEKSYENWSKHCYDSRAFIWLSWNTRAEGLFDLSWVAEKMNKWNYWQQYQMQWTIQSDSLRDTHVLLTLDDHGNTAMQVLQPTR